MSEVTGNAATGTPDWVDLGIPDLERAKEFYNAVFGWEFLEGPPETGGYTMCLVRGRRVAAIMRNPDPTATAFWWNVYFATDDLDGAVKRISDAGGTVPMAAMDVLDQGRMAIAVDPQGAQFGLWQGMAMHGAELVNEPGAFAWNELVTPDAAGAAAFYSAVFDRPVESMNVPGMDYRTVKVDGRDVAGVHGLPDAPAARWTTYFAVADADEAARTALAHGGTVVAEPKDSPYGRFGILRDPFGAEFAAMRLQENPPE
jgi:predicted enzyme related to lactoylglutathione lyase